ncbi:hypothetical protein FHL15_005384 [Xylaria flabelliformis]|uniref:Trichothecene 3-O-acetyltransferase-like N-terminal domain-containing protein n=1 Tax=Xylaria flabelliformis TaxID=2512241 RepID=A0A553I0H3_9PEZI|nr:hypothetical protein FHL15_005384 [Xylaria flabelliformis]
MICYRTQRNSLCSEIPDDFRVEDIPNVLIRGAERLAEHFPWVAGQVVCEGAMENSTRCFKTKVSEDKPRLWVRYLQGDPPFSSWDTLKKLGFPMNALDESIVTPRKTTSGPGESTPAVVFQLQATIIKGGLIITFIGHHQAMDGTGQAQVISLFSKACSGEIFTHEELRIGNLSPENSVQILNDPWTPGRELEYNIIKQETSQPGPAELWSRSGEAHEVRRPRFDSLPGLVYFMPKSRDGAIGVAICLSADDTENLRSDTEFIKHAIHVG